MLRMRQPSGRPKALAGAGGPYRARLRLLGLAIVVALAGWHLYSPHDASRNSLLTRVNAVWYDWRFQAWPPQRDAAIPIVIVDLDEATQQHEGRWPWDRRKVAELVTALQGYGAALIGFDVVFSEPGGNPVSQILDTAELPPFIADALSPLLATVDGDSALARVLSEQTVLGYFFHADGASAGALPPPFLELTDDLARASSLRSMPNYTANLRILTENALSTGFVVAVPDADGIVRRIPLAMRYKTGVYASLSLELARLALGAPWLRLQQDAHDDVTVVTGIRIGQHVTVPLDERGHMLVPYRGPAGSFPTVSATGVLRGDAPADLLHQLQGAIILVGTSALGLGDLRTIPLQTAYPGVEVHANALDAMLTAAMQKMESAQGAALTESGRQLRSPFYHRPDWEPGASLALLLVAGLGLAWLLPGRSPFSMLVLVFGALAVVTGVNVVLWHVGHLSLPLALQALATLAVGGLNIAAGYVIATRQKRTIESLFGEYVPADHVARMLADPQSVSLEGEQRNMTVLFADVRNFTALSESLSASELKSALNRYLSAITEVIFEHHGTIDKYVGDLVMAFWNAPLDDPQHAGHAVQAALAMQARMRELRREFAAQGLPEFHIGIGVNTGVMNVGDMGSSYRRAYTVLGDAVNLASRLEGLTDFYGVSILVSDTTRAHTPDIAYRTVDIARVKGRSQALTLSQPLDAIADADLIAVLDPHEQAVADYQAGRWKQARAGFQELDQRLAHDRLSGRYLDAMARLGADQPPPGWEAVTDHQTK